MSIIYGKGIYIMGEPPVPTASLTPQEGVTYTSGISGIDPAMLTMFSQAISNNADITSETNTVYVDYKSTHVKIDVANRVTIGLNGTNYTFNVIGFNHDTLTNPAAYGATTKTGKAGFTLQMRDTYYTTYPMNSSNTDTGGWKSSDMRTSTMVTMKGYMPTAWQSAIKTVNKASGLGGGSSSGTETVSDNCFLLAEIEIFGSTTYSVSGEGTQYAYYKAGKSKVKNQGGFYDSAIGWWERSPNSGNNSRFCFVDIDGLANRFNASSGAGVAFAFCI